MVKNQPQSPLLLPQLRNEYSTDKPQSTVPIDDFVKFCKIDLRLLPRTVECHKYFMKRIFDRCGSDPSTAQLRDFLASIPNDNTRNNYIKSMRIYFRDYCNNFDRVKSFRFSNSFSMPIWCPSKSDLKQFYDSLDDFREKALFLLYASSGRRKNEILSLKLNDVDLDQRLIKPNKESATKHTWYSFYNNECAKVLNEYLNVRRDLKRSERLIPISSINFYNMFAIAHRKSGVPITSKVLRFWFANEMARLGVPDRFIDAYQGRIPRSVLARHYTDYSLDSLKQIYDRASISVLS